MDVCFVAREILSSSVEGHHNASRNIIEAATSAGIHAEILSVESKAEETTNHHLTIISSKASLRSDFSFLPGIISALDDLFTSTESMLRIKYFRNNLVHILNVNKEAYVVMHHLLRVKNPLLLHFFHSSQVLADDIFFIRKLAFMAGLYGRHFDNHVIAANHSLYEYLTEKLGADFDHVHYVPCPINTDRFKPLSNRDNLREKYGLPIDRPMVVYAGSLDPARGIFNLVAAIPKVSKNVPNVLFYVSYLQRKGEEAYEKHLCRLVQNLKIEDNIVIRGPSAKIEEIYNLADLVVLPFLRPYWVDPPLVLLEAMSSGACVITNSVGAIGEVIRNYENAILARVEEPRSLVESILKILKSPESSREMGQKARNTILGSYSYEAVGKRLWKVYSSVLESA